MAKQRFINFHTQDILPPALSPVNDVLPFLTCFTKSQNERVLNESHAEGRFHIHSYLEIFYFESGEGFLETKEEKIHLKADDFLIINANHVHRQYSDNQQPLVYYCFDVTNLNLSGFEPNTISDDTYKLKSFSSPNNVIYKKIKQLLQIIKKQQINCFFEIQALVYQILSHALLLFVKRNDAIEKDNFEKHVKDYINTHFQNPITLDTLENIFFVSRSQLSHRFKIAYGISPIRYLINVRLENAKILLEKTDYGITEISQKVGFGNSNYFSDQFRKYRGMSPTEYRKYQRDVFIEKPGGNT